MGLAIAAVYSGVFWVVAAVALVLSYFAFKGTAAPDERTHLLRIWAYVLGFLATPALATLAAFAFPGYPPKDEWLPLFQKLAITLFLPVTVGTCLLVAAKLARGKARSVLGWLSAGALHGAIITPGVAVQTYEWHRKHEQEVAKADFADLCTRAEVKRLEHVAPAESLTLPDSMGFPLAEGLVANSRLQFAERARLPHEAKDFPANYLRISKHGDASSGQAGPRAHLLKSPIEALSGEYRMFLHPLEVATESRPRWIGSRIEIRRVSDDRLVAFAQYYQDRQYQWICPEQISNSLFFNDFVKDALNVRNAVDLDLAAQEQNCIKLCGKTPLRWRLVERHPWGSADQSGQAGPWTCQCH